MEGAASRRRVSESVAAASAAAVAAIASHQRRRRGGARGRSMARLVRPSYQRDGSQIPPIFVAPGPQRVPVFGSAVPDPGRAHHGSRPPRPPATDGRVGRGFRTQQAGGSRFAPSRASGHRASRDRRREESTDSGTDFFCSHFPRGMQNDDPRSAQTQEWLRRKSARVRASGTHEVWRTMLQRIQVRFPREPPFGNMVENRSHYLQSTTAGPTERCFSGAL